MSKKSGKYQSQSPNTNGDVSILLIWSMRVKREAKMCLKAFMLFYLNFLPPYRERLASSSRSSLHKERQALKPVSVVAKSCHYIIMWCTETLWKTRLWNGHKSLTKPQMTHFTVRIWAIQSKAARLHLNPAQVSSALICKLTSRSAEVWSAHALRHPAGQQRHN